MFNIEKLRARGIPESSIKICEQINENNRRRESCTGHDFEMPEPGKYPMKFICKVCGYEADSQYVQGYNDAYKHK
jgi:hypothetical protein